MNNNVRKGTMIKRIVKNKWGVTLLEGLIAMGLLALVAAGTFGVLLSISRQTATTDLRDEMLLAIENATEQLQRYANSTESGGLCGDDSDPLSASDGTIWHGINCMLPPICDTDASSEFSYQVVEDDSLKSYLSGVNDREKIAAVTVRNIKFRIRCNGYTLQ